MDYSEVFKSFAEAVSPALQTLLLALVTALAAQASAWMVKAFQSKRVELSTTEQYLVDMLVGSFVHAAEQVLVDGKDKLEYVFANTETALTRYGIVLDADVLYAIIEANVHKTFTELK